MMRRQFGDELVDQLTQVPLAVLVVWTRVGILELERSLLVVPSLGEGLEQHQRVARPVAQFVLRQVGGDRVDPRRELLRLVESGQMTIHANEDLLHEILRALAIPDRPVDEVQQANLISRDDFAESALVTGQKGAHQIGVIRNDDIRTSRRRVYGGQLEGGVSHRALQTRGRHRLERASALTSDSGARDAVPFPEARSVPNWER